MVGVVLGAMELSDAHSHFTQDVENHRVVPVSIYSSFHMPTRFEQIWLPQSEVSSD